MTQPHSTARRTAQHINSHDAATQHINTSYRAASLAARARDTAAAATGQHDAQHSSHTTQSHRTCHFNTRYRAAARAHDTAATSQYDGRTAQQTTQPPTQPHQHKLIEQLASSSTRVYIMMQPQHSSHDA